MNAGLWRLRYYAPAAAWAAFVLYLGRRQIDVPFEPYAFPWDKVAHLVLYGVLGALAAIGWRLAGRWPHVALPMVFALAVGVIDELGQRAVASRSADPFDFMADLVAIVVVFAILRRRWKPEEAK